MWHHPKVTFACLLTLAWLGGAHAATQVGERFPPLETGAFEGGPLPATEGKVTLVDFWASWCAPCKSSFPAYTKLHDSYRARGLVIVAVSADENPAAFEAFVRRATPPFATVRDKSHQLMRQVDIPTMPTCYLLGRDGRVRFIHQGFHGPETDLRIRREIDSLLSEIPPSP